MFRATKNGFNIFPDRWVEHGVRFVRMFTGGKKAQGAVTTFVSAVRQVSLLLVHRLRMKSEVQGQTNEADDFADTEHGRKVMQLDKVFFKSFLHFCNLNLFGIGAPKCAPSKPHKECKQMDPTTWPTVGGDPTNLRDPTGTNLVNEEILFCLSCGMSQAPNCFDHFELKADANDAKHSEETVSLAAIDPDKSEKQSTAQSAIDGWVSCDAVVVGNLSLDDVKKDHKELNEKLANTDKAKVIGNSNGKKNKPEFSTALAKVRKKLIESDPNWAETQKREKATDGTSKLPIKPHDVRRDQLLGGNFFKFPDSVRNRCKSKKCQFNAENQAVTAAAAASPGSVEPEIPESQDTNVSSPSAAPPTPSTAEFGHRDLKRDLW